MKNEPYIPIACGLVDEIEAAIVTHQEGDIVYENEDGNTCTYTGKAKTWESRSNVGEYLILVDNAAIRLDRVISFFGKPFSGSCAV